jgi:hypothetical protein
MHGDEPGSLLSDDPHVCWVILRNEHANLSGKALEVEVGKDSS